MFMCVSEPALTSVLSRLSEQALVSPTLSYTPDTDTGTPQSKSTEN